MHNPLEDYLQAVEKHLGRMDAYQRASELQEIRQHLETMIQAHSELGCDEAEAVRATLEQFGSARKVGGELARVWQRTEDLPARGNLLIATIAPIVLGYVIGRLSAFGMMHLILQGNLQSNTPTGLFWWIVTVIVNCVLVGWMTALLAPRKAVTGLLLCYLFSLLENAFFVYPHLLQTASDIVLRFLAIQLALGLTGLGLQMIGAQAARRRLRRRKQIAR